MNEQPALSLIETIDLKKYFPITAGLFHKQVGSVRAVDGVSITIRKGETVGLVGESGCGKSTLGRLILRLEIPTGGKIRYQGQDITEIGEGRLKWFRRQTQMVFQDPQSSLDPRMTIGEAIGEALLIHGMKDEKKRFVEVTRLLDRVGIEPSWLDRYPHQFSGGQKQRIGIARALAVHPGFLVADEPVSALDVSVQAQILNLLMDLRDEFNLTYLFIAHDLAVVKHMSDHIAVMYLGKIVEIADRVEIISNPMHPYTRALLASILVPNPHKRKKLELLRGEVPSPANPPPGCHFHPRCPNLMDICRRNPPQLDAISCDHLVSCHLYAIGRDSKQ